MRRHLAPGGVACVWVQGFSVSPETIGTLLTTFNAAFDRFDLWETRTSGDFLLTGYDDAMPIDVDQIARGAKAGGIPMRAPSHFHTGFNLKTAKALGLVISPTLLARADEVIE